jgi:hypothetical protein
MAKIIKIADRAINSFLFFFSSKFTPLIIISDMGIQRIKSNPSNLVKEERIRIDGISIQKIIFLCLLSSQNISPTIKKTISTNGYLNKFKFPGNGFGWRAKK